MIITQVVSKLMGYLDFFKSTFWMSLIARFVQIQMANDIKIPNFDRNIIDQLYN